MHCNELCRRFDDFGVVEYSYLLVEFVHELINFARGQNEFVSQHIRPRFAVGFRFTSFRNRIERIESDIEEIARSGGSAIGEVLGIRPTGHRQPKHCCLGRPVQRTSPLVDAVAGDPMAAAGEGSVGTAVAAVPERFVVKKRPTADDASGAV